jgi:deoxyribodipyrimidine photolyase-like uncharacterized protein
MISLIGKRRDECPFTTLQQDFLDGHRARCKRNARLKLQVDNLERKGDGELNAMRERAKLLQGHVDARERI